MFHVLMWTDNNIKHLGHVFTMNNNNAAILAKRNNFYYQANYFSARFGHLPIMLKCKRFVNFCYASYG